MARLRSRCKGVTDGKTQGTAERMGETMVEASTDASRKRDNAVGYDNTTSAKLRMYEDGSGLFELIRDTDNISIRWGPEKIPLELFAAFNDIEGMLVPAEETPREVTP